MENISAKRFEIIKADSSNDKRIFQFQTEFQTWMTSKCNFCLKKLTISKCKFYNNQIADNFFAGS